ncbi:MAG: C25 family cysteine peptidase, partial [bacterium]
MLRKGRSLFQYSTFYKFSIQEEGIYKIDGAFLESKNINLNQIEPAKIRLFNNGGRELPRDSNAPRPSGMIENAIVVEDGGDGRFDANDYILFYGNGVSGWEYHSAARSYSHYINHYGFDNVYWLTFDSQQDGKRMTQVSSGTAIGEIQGQYQGLAFIEEELDNPLRSGLNFFGRQFSISESGQTQSYHLDLPNAIPSNTEQLKFRLASKNSGLHKFAISVNNNFVENAQFFGANSDLGQYLVIKAFDFSIATTNRLTPGSNTIQLNYSHSSSTGQALLDWIELFYTAQLSAVEDELAFNVLPDSGAQAYRISNFSNSPVQLFDITDFSDVKQIVNGSFSDGSLTFTDFQQPNLPKRYLALNPSKYKSVQNLERIKITDLRTPGRGAEFIIISHDDFYSEAQRLESLRENGNPGNRLQTEVVRISDIYNNFSGGLLDPVAIRDFIKYAYENWSPSPAYVLLLGDGDYDYKNILSKGDKNWIPTFETDELPESMTLQELKSRTTDSWFTYVSGNDQVMDLAIGRINAQSLTDTKNAVDKIIAYETQPLWGNWHNTITMVGDDELIRGGNP